MTARDRRNPNKVYVKVRADHLPDGRVIPLLIRTGGGEVIRIDRIVDVREAPALKAGGQGTRYTCQVPQRSDSGALEREIYLFHDRNQWFLEE